MAKLVLKDVFDVLEEVGAAVCLPLAFDFFLDHLRGLAYEFAAGDYESDAAQDHAVLVEDGHGELELHGSLPFEYSAHACADLE